MDSFICGSCAVVFYDIGAFLAHKKICIQLSLDNAHQTVEMVQPASVQATVLDADGKSTTFIIINGDVDNEMSLSSRFKEVDATVSANANPPHNSMNSSQHNVAVSCTSGRKRGRPRKSERKNPSSSSVTETVSLSEQSADGSYTCSRCHRLFTKLRQFTSHKCPTVSDSVNERTVTLADCDEMLNSRDFDKPDCSVMTSADQPKLVRESRDISDPLLSSPLTFDRPLQSAGCASAESLSSSSKMPVFQTEEDRLLFDSCLAVDIAPFVSGMYTSHAVEQNVTECGSGSGSGVIRPAVNLFTCTTCSKVFSSLARCQLHCLSHTTARPYQCPWCSYSTTVPGNLYTHARRHTGMMFHCSRCSFKTANRSHLAEHEQTHVGDRQHTCELCQRDYKTLKSLINHTRKYHARSPAGASYLARLQRETRGKKHSSSRYKCAVCTAKFTSLLYRDRHLRTHVNVSMTDGRSTTHDVVVCSLCSENCDRQSYMRTHLPSHQLIYFCSVCSAFFPSSLRLMSHLVVHQNQQSLSPADLFWQSIAMSVFLPRSSDWLDASTDIACEPQMNSDPRNSLEDVLQDVECALVPVFPHSDTELLSGVSNSAHECGREVAECGEETDAGCTDVDASTSSFNIPCIDRKLCFKMGFKPMNQNVFSRLRQAFGCVECEHCGKLFFAQSNRDAHVNVHTVDRRTLTCSQCSHVTSTLDSLHSHVQHVHELKTYVCDTCGTALASRSQLWTHRQNAHGAPMQYLCLPCKLTYPTIKRLRIHLEMKHTELSRDQIKSQLAALRTRRAKTGRRMPVCPYCNRVFRNASSDLQKHIWIHEGIKPFECHVCQYACRTRSNLAAHMLRHSADKPFLCNSCGRAYKSRTALRWHERSHVHGRIFKCDKCSYEAVQLSHLRRHLETHDVQKCFACSHCDYSANTVSYLKMHQTRQHPSSAPTIITRGHGSGLQCHICHYRFGNTSDLKRHAKLRHGIDPSPHTVTNTTVVSTTSLNSFTLKYQSGTSLQQQQQSDQSFIAGHSEMQLKTLASSSILNPPLANNY